MRIKDMGEIFAHPLLKGLSTRLLCAQTIHDPLLDKIHAAQDMVQIEELNWTTMRCYIHSKVGDRSHPWVKNMVKSLLIEYYGSRALQLQIVVQSL